MQRLIPVFLIAFFATAVQAQYVDADGREWMRIDKTFSFAGSLLARCTPNCEGVVTQYDYNQTTHSYSNPRQLALGSYVLASKEEAQQLMDTVGLFSLGYSGWIAPTYSYDAWVYAYTSSKDEAGLPYIAYAQEGHAMVSFYFSQGFTTNAGQGPIGGLLYRDVNQPKNCIYLGAEILDGESFTAYQSETVAYDQSCQSEIRTCSNGVLSGSFTAASCSVNPVNNCSYDNEAILHGEGFTAYESETVAYDESCNSEVRTCTDGSLSGSFTALTCSVTPALNCTYNGQTVLHGQQVTGYSASSASILKTWGTSCTNLRVSRTCTDGSLGGTLYPTCLETTYRPDRCEVKNGAIKCKSGKSPILSTKLYS